MFLPFLLLSQHCYSRASLSNLFSFVSSLLVSSPSCSPLTLRPSSPLQVSLPLGASGPSGGCAGSLPGSLQLHRGPQVDGAQPFRCHHRTAGAVCPRGWAAGHQRHRLNPLNVTSDPPSASIHPSFSQINHHAWTQYNKVPNTSVQFRGEALYFIN